MQIIILSLVLVGIFYTSNNVWSQSIPELTCTDRSDGKECIEACVTKYPGTTGVCRNETCLCSSDPLDVKCGGDGSFGGLDYCPDIAACQQKCCREGYSSSMCWFGFKCICTGVQATD